MYAIKRGTCCLHRYPSKIVYIERYFSSKRVLYHDNALFAGERSKYSHAASSTDAIRNQLELDENLEGFFNEDVVKKVKRSIKNVVQKLLSDEDGMGSNLLETASKEDADAMKKRWQMLLQQDKWASITYTQAIKILREAHEAGKADFRYKPTWGESLKSEHEKWLAGKYFKNPVFVTDYPLEQKAFYMKINEPDGYLKELPPTVACYDMLVPDIGELIGGSIFMECLALKMDSITPV